MKRTTISLPDSVAILLRDEARRRGTSVSEIARKLISDGLIGSHEKPRDVPFAGIVDDPDMVPSDRIDEYLEKTWQDAGDRDRR